VIENATSTPPAIALMPSLSMSLQHCPLLRIRLGGLAWTEMGSYPDPVPAMSPL
jgi:hypothetical protein